MTFVLTRPNSDPGSVVSEESGSLRVVAFDLEINPETGRAEFVSKDKMRALLEGHPELQERLEREQSEQAAVMYPYLQTLQRSVGK